MRPPVTFDPLTALLEHNHWATSRVLELCAGLTTAQFHQAFEIGPGSLHDTLRPIVHNMRAWSDDVEGWPNRSTPKPVTVPELRQLLDDSTAELRSILARYKGRLHEPIPVQFQQDGPTFAFTRGVAITHLLVHGTHHRAQCLNMLRHLKVPGISDKLPDLDLNEWQYETECKP